MNAGVRDDGTLILDPEGALPEVLDVLVVGGGPAGTAAAFRATELEMSVLVIDFDDLLKRIRDYAEDKPILPHYGGGDRMAFPDGGELITALRFEDIDKDELCTRWKGLYEAFNVPAQVGLELTGLARDPDGVWTATVWNHALQAEESLRARHVVLGLGRGVPRRFDIPGDVDGIAYRLDDPKRYVGAPVCVIGGGTSAAEAVIAVSHAKAEAGDGCSVYWSYRGAKMPRVSKALADTFFQAYVANGNTRYYPNSEPVAVVVGEDRRSYLSIRVDRKSIDGRPHETTHLEFPKERCIACIGEDIPEHFLGDLGIHLVVGGPRKKKMMTVSPLLETVLPNVYLIGDLLSPAYLETDDFEGDPSAFQPVKHRGNIKTSLTDGVFVAEVIRQKLDGRKTIEVSIREPAPESVTSAPRTPLPQVPTAPEGPPEGAIAEGRPEADAAHLIRITPAGVEEEEFSLKPDGATTIGRVGCDVSFPEDGLLSDRHASVLRRADGFVLRDEASETGTFLQLRHGRPRAVAPDDLIRLGRQILVVRREDGHHVIHHHDQEGRLVQRHRLGQGTIVVGRSGGRTAPDLILDPTDATLSRFHLSVTLEGDEVRFEDFNSRNGSYLGVRDIVKLEHGDLFRIGRQALELRAQADLPTKTGSWSLATGETVAATKGVADESLPITFLGNGPPVMASASDSILDVAERNDVEIDYECRIGMCGCDLIRVVEGVENLDEPSEQEIRALRRRGLEPGTHRLACVTRASGPVVVEIVD